MKTASVRDMRNKFPALLRMIQNGETVTITSRRKVVATLAPPPRAQRPRRAWADVKERLARLNTLPLMSITAAELLADGRERFL